MRFTGLAVLYMRALTAKVRACGTGAVVEVVMKKLAGFSLCIVGAAFGSSGCVTSSEGQQMRADISQLQTELEQTKSTQEDADEDAGRRLEAMEGRVVSLEKTLSALRQSDADTGVQMEKVIAELQILRGELEEARYALGETRDQLGKTKQSVEDILARPPIELQTAATAEMIEPEKGSTIGGQPIPDGAQELYDFGKGLFDAKDYPSAIEAFQLFVARHKDKGELRDNAYFWMGESHFQSALGQGRDQAGAPAKGAQEQFKKALLAYREVMEDQSSNKHDGALFKSGRVFEELGFAEAPVFYEELIKTHPKSNLVKEAKKRLAALKKKANADKKKRRKRR